MSADTVRWLDEDTAVVWVPIAPERIVWLQSLFELYEGLGLVRTFKPGETTFGDALPDVSAPRVGVVTTKSQLNDCLRAVAEVGMA